MFFYPIGECYITDHVQYNLNNNNFVMFEILQFC